MFGQYYDTYCVKSGDYASLCRITYYIGSHFEIQDGVYIGPKLSWHLVLLFSVYASLPLCQIAHFLYIWNDHSASLMGQE